MSQTIPMNEHFWIPRKIVVHRESMDSPLYERIRGITGDVETEIIDDTPRFEQGMGTPDTLYIIPQKSRFVRNCPGTHGYYICCGYRIFDLVRNCIYKCEYCILRSYFQDRSIIAFSNVETGLQELERLLEGNPGTKFRFGTGEFTDSLAMEPLLGHSTSLVPFFAKFKNAVLELKTKSVAIECLQPLEHNSRTIVSWSLNPGPVLKELESGTPGLEQRLEAAALCVKWGYRVGFHFDPVIYFPGWENQYEDVIRKLFQHVDSRHIAWISAGILRFPPSMKHFLGSIMENPFFNQGETIRGIDGKIRYFKPLRIKILKKIRDYLKTYGGNVITYLCMESPEVWRQVYSDNPGLYLEIPRVLDSMV